MAKLTHLCSDASIWDGDEYRQGLASREQLAHRSPPEHRILRRLHSSQAKDLRMGRRESLDSLMASKLASMWHEIGDGI